MDAVITSSQDMNTRLTNFVVLCTVAVLTLPGLGDEVQPGELDVPYEPTPMQVVELMLKLADVTNEDYVIDLGCGDGRIVIAAAKRFGARGLGIDLDPQRIRESKDSASYEGVANLVQFRVADIMDTSIQRANVVTLYLLDRVNLMVRPKLFQELKPGTRVVSHAFHMADWEADKIVRNPKARNDMVLFWVIPAPIGGTWRWTTETSTAEIPTILKLQQEFQGLSGTASFPGTGQFGIADASITGKTVNFTAKLSVDGVPVRIVYRGTVEGNIIQGTQEWLTGPFAGGHPWNARREPVDLTGSWQVNVQSSPDLNGTLHIARKDNMFIATYVKDQDQNKLSLPAFYTWGSSVRFDVPTDGNPLIFTGSLGLELSEGTLFSEGRSDELTWLAKRVSDELPTPIQLSTDSDNQQLQVRRMQQRASQMEEPMPSDSNSVTISETIIPSVSRVPQPQTKQPRQWTSQMGEPLPGDEYTNPKDNSVLVWVPGGEFVMGSNGHHEDEEPPHKVKIRGFWLGRFEVTNRQYAEFMEVEQVRPPYYWDNQDFNQPVTGVTWLNAKAYCEWAGLRMPSEAEWEYAASAGGQLEYPTSTGDISHSLANTRGVEGKDCWNFASPVGSFPPNPFGLYDMAGNAWEWTSTVFTEYPYSATDGREDQERQTLRVVRGGAWSFPFDYCRARHRHRFASHLQSGYTGIRVAMTRIDVD